MTLALFGASGRTGGAVTRLALARGWTVRAQVRSASPFEALAGVEVVRGSLDSPAGVAATLSGTTGVCCVFGPRSTSSAPFCANATELIVQGMKTSGVRRLVCLTGAMVGDLPSSVSIPMRILAGIFRRRVPQLAVDSAAQERVVMRSGLDWTIVKPPRLTDGPATGRVRAEPSLPVGLFSRISRHDLAAFLVDELGSASHLRERVYVRS